MESNLETLIPRSSLPVPYVQDLAKKSLATVPSRYVRPDQDPPFRSDSSSPGQVPIIDMNKLLSEESELDKFHNACKDWGFFQLINHGVSESLVETMKAEATNFFNLPTDEKKKFASKKGEVEGYGQLCVLSEEQKLDWCDLLSLTTIPVHLRKDYLLPKFPLPLRNALEAYSKEMENLGMKIINVMAKSLSIKPSDDMVRLFEPEGWQAMRLNYYPPCPEPELVMGLSPHSDGSGVTILLQVNETDGLQVKKDGNWIPIQSADNAFIINIGDMLEVMSNGIYSSIEHRAVIDSVKERISIATFCSPRLDFHNACKDWGFFQLVNHGVSESLVEKMKVEAKNLFNLPSDEKRKFASIKGEVEGYGQLFVVSEEQKLDWCDLLSLTLIPIHSRKDYLLPNFPLPLRNALEAYSKEMENLSKKIFNLMTKSLKIEPSDDLVRLFEPEGWQVMRLSYYPPCPQPELVMGLSPHSDGSGVTILLQVNEIDGLQVKKDGNWVLIQPVANAFIINIGDMLEVISNGIYPSIEHRAVVNSVKERISISTFCSPRLDAEIGPMPSLITPQTAPLFKRFAYADYLKTFFSRELDRKSRLHKLRVSQN
ncbi:protein SRG1-like [Mercurialis annua]|uniref:protein SRG1-like n=1 Tax=Mercurialis annua TaxID=3986 RepID=UPI0024ADE2E1|nr:protein SRG1-like [Mercurialis annua]